MSFQESSAFGRWFRQLHVLNKKNFILLRRYWKTTFAQTVLAPLVVLLLLYLLQQAQNRKDLISNPHPTAYNLDGLPKCQGFIETAPCITLMFTPNEQQYVQYLQTFARKNKERTGIELKVHADVFSDLNRVPAESLDIVPVPNADFIYDYTLRNPNVTFFGVQFEKNDNDVKYQIWYNQTQTANETDPFGASMLQLMRGLDEAIISSVGKTEAKFDIKLKDFPLIPSILLGEQIVQSLGPVFFVCTTMFIFIVALNTIVMEKEMRLRISMEMAGLYPSVYWLSWLVSNAVLVSVNSVMTVVFGMVFGFSIFRKADFMVLFMTFFLFGLAMVMFAFFITTLCAKSRSAVLVGIFVCIISLLFMSFIFSTDRLGYIWYDSKSPSFFQQFFPLLPFYNFGKMYLDIVARTAGKRDFLTDTFAEGPGFQWNALYDPIPTNFLPTFNGRVPNVPVPVTSFYFLLMNMALFGILTWFFDNVLPNEYGARKPVYFFLMPSYWGWTSRKNKENEQHWLQRIRSHAINEQVEEQDDDVAHEARQALDEAYDCTVRIVHLRKEFKSSWFRASKLDKTAVKNTCLTLREGKLLALLGQNGAGKSTTMNILSGLTPATNGDALFYGYSVRENMAELRNNLGVCPQHDILFNDLTSKEHFDLYAGIKNVPARDIAALMKERLQAVRLWKVKDKEAGTYSGGMKRRLSLVLSTIGDPKVIFMDEPTTGMDPVNRRHVWSFVERFKRDKVIVLTTHSMEEADVLADNIAIMAHGRLRAIGNSVHLKNKFGAGYRISLTAEPHHVEQLQTFVQQQVPRSVLEDASAGSLIYQIPNQAMEMIPPFVKWLESMDHAPADQRLVKSWSISQTTLEEVFLRIIREANNGGYSGYERSNSVSSGSSRSDANSQSNELSPLNSPIRAMPSTTERPENHYFARAERPLSVMSNVSSPGASEPTYGQTMAPIFRANSQSKQSAPPSSAVKTMSSANERPVNQYLAKAESPLSVTSDVSSPGTSEPTYGQTMAPIFENIQTEAETDGAGNFQQPLPLNGPRRGQGGSDKVPNSEYSQNSLLLKSIMFDDDFVNELEFR